MKKLVVFASILLFSLLTLTAEEIKYTEKSFARINFVKGNSYIQKAADLSYEEGVINMPITEGDRLGTTEGRVEIYLGHGNYIRVDRNTKLDFEKLPKKGDDITQIKIWSGSVYFSIDTLEREKSIEIHSSDVSVYLMEGGLYRADVRQNVETEVFVFNGMLEAAGTSDSHLLNEAQRIEAIEGHFTTRPTRFMAVPQDSFDRWSEDRDSEVRKEMAHHYLPEDLEDYEYELDTYGEWAYIPPYGNVWVPGGVQPDWRPYNYGRWTWLPLAGWTWISYQPWGWVTSHYGRWHWGLEFGWYWIPVSGWGPGWVSWYWGNDYYGWSPMSYYGYPGYIIDNIYYGRYIENYPYNSRALTVIHKNQLRARNISNVTLQRDSVKNLGKLRFNNNAPANNMGDKKVAIQKLNDNKVFLKDRDSTVKFKPGTSLNERSTRNPAQGETRNIKKSSTARYPSSGERIVKKKTKGYPPSPKITSRNKSKRSSSRRSGSSLGRLYDRISGSRKISKSRSSSRSSSKGIKSRSTSKSSTARSSAGRSSSTRSSTKSRSSSKSSKTKKKGGL